MPFREAVVPFIPPLPSSLKLLSALSEDQFALFEREIRGHEAFRRNNRRVEELRIKLDLKDAADVLGLLATARFLYDRAQEWAAPGEDAAEAIRSFFISTDLWEELGPNPERTFSRVLALTKPNPMAARDKKRKWLKSGILPSASGFASFVDLRPSFTPGRDHVDEFIPIIIFGIDVETTSGEESTISFQTTVTGLHRLERVIEDARTKLDRLKYLQNEQFTIAFDEESLS